ncbi:MAG: ATP-grasp domain-containing protein [Nitrospiraceae bacterium]|nr:MAG: ATP-grasp domain-containing protein [Nitrospiraceae bacterium]
MKAGELSCFISNFHKTMKKIMITAAGGPAGFCLAKYLSGKAYLIGLDSDMDSPAQFYCNEVHSVPFAVLPNYKEEMLKVIRKTSPDIIIPTFDEDLLFFDSVRDLIDNFILLSPFETIHVCDDKRKTANKFKDIAAKTYSLDDAIVPCTYPLFIKPAIGRGSKTGFKVDNDTDLKYALSQVKEPFIQEWLQGPEVTADTFADLDGRLLGISPRIRIQTRGGISTKARFIKDVEIEMICTLVHERLKIIGPANIQCMKDHGGNWKLLEINPRYSGGLGLSYQAGFDSITPLLTIDSTKKTIRVEKMSPYYGVTVVRFWEERIAGA